MIGWRIRRDLVTPGKNESLIVGVWIVPASSTRNTLERVHSRNSRCSPRRSASSAPWSRASRAASSRNAREIDLIDAWFAGGTPTDQPQVAQPTEAPQATQIPQAAAPAPAVPTPEAPLPLGERTARWWQETTGEAPAEPLATVGANDGNDEFPRIVRNRLKA